MAEKGLAANGAAEAGGSQQSRLVSEETNNRCAIFNLQLCLKVSGSARCELETPRAATQGGTKGFSALIAPNRLSGYFVGTRYRELNLGKKIQKCSSLGSKFVFSIGGKLTSMSRLPGNHSFFLIGFKTQPIVGGKSC